MSTWNPLRQWLPSLTIKVCDYLLTAYIPECVCVLLFCVHVHVDVKPGTNIIVIAVVTSVRGYEVTATVIKNSATHVGHSEEQVVQVTTMILLPLRN